MLGKMLILLTGATGYVGQWVLQAFTDSGFQVHELKADITDTEALQSELSGKVFQVVVHLAGSHSKDESELNDVNVIGTRNLLNSLDLETIDQFIFMSSIHVYGQVSGIVTENHRLEPLSAYGLSKRDTEMTLKKSLDPKKLTIFRSSNAYGAPKSKKTDKWGLLFNDLCKQAYTGNKIVVNSAANKLIDTVWMGHVVETLLATIEGKVPPGTYNLTSGNSVPLSTIANSVKDSWKEYSGKELSVEYGEVDFTTIEYQYSRDLLDKFIGPYKANAFKEEALKIFDLLCNASTSDRSGVNEEIKYSLVMPVYMADAYIAGSLERVVDVMEGIAEPYELILVDDHSSDNTWQVLNELKTKYAQLHVFRLKKNSGQTPATQFGVEKARGTYIITLDDDMQHPPEEIPVLIAAMEQADVALVFGDPADRYHPYKQHSMLVGIGKFFFHSVFLREYKHVNFFTTFRLFNRALLSTNGGPWEHLFFIWQIPPSSAAHVSTAHAPRVEGNSNHHLLSTIRHYAPFLWYFTYMSVSWALYFILMLGIIVIGYFVLRGVPILNGYTTAFIVCAILLNLVKYIAQYNLSVQGEKQIEAQEI